LLHLAEPNRAKAIQTLIAESKVSRTKAELERLGFTSQDAGQALLDMWRFPAELGLAVKHFKKPLAAPEPLPLSAILNLACYINACVRDKRDEESVKESFPVDVALLAGVDSDTINELGDALALESGLDGLNG
jgi:HD-like signal output (HDOD) protein